MRERWLSGVSALALFVAISHWMAGPGEALSPRSMTQPPRARRKFGSDSGDPRRPTHFLY